MIWSLPVTVHSSDVPATGIYTQEYVLAVVRISPLRGGVRYCHIKPEGYTLLTALLFLIILNSVLLPDHYTCSFHATSRLDSERSEAKAEDLLKHSFMLQCAESQGILPMVWLAVN